MNSDGLMDFTTGAFQGGTAGAQMSGGNPFAIGAGALAMGAMSYFGGAGQRRLERRANAQALELGDLEVATARRNSALEKEALRRKEKFSKLLSRYFRGGL